MGGCASSESDQMSAPRSRAARSWQLLPANHKENFYRSLYMRCLIHLEDHHTRSPGVEVVGGAVGGPLSNEGSMPTTPQKGGAAPAGTPHLPRSGGGVTSTGNTTTTTATIASASSSVTSGGRQTTRGGGGGLPPLYSGPTAGSTGSGGSSSPRHSVGAAGGALSAPRAMPPGGSCCCSTPQLQKFALSMPFELFKRRVSALMESLILLNPKTALTLQGVLALQYPTSAAKKGASRKGAPRGAEAQQSSPPHIDDDGDSDLDDDIISFQPPPVGDPDNRSTKSNNNSSESNNNNNNRVPRDGHEANNAAPTFSLQREKTALLWGVAFAHMGWSAVDVNLFVRMLVDALFVACEEAERVHKLAVQSYQHALSHPHSTASKASVADSPSVETPASTTSTKGPSLSTERRGGYATQVADDVDGRCSVPNCVLCQRWQVGEGPSNGGDCEGDGRAPLPLPEADWPWTSLPPKFEFTKEDASAWAVVFRFRCADEILKGFYKALSALTQLAGHASSLCAASIQTFTQLSPPPSLSDGSQFRRGRTWSYTGGSGSNGSHSIRSPLSSSQTSPQPPSSPSPPQHHRPPHLRGGVSPPQQTHLPFTPASYHQHVATQQELMTLLRTATYAPPSDALWLSDTLFPKPPRAGGTALPMSSASTSIGGTCDWDAGLRACGLDAFTSSLVNSASSIASHAIVTSDEVLVPLAVRAAVLRHRVIYIYPLIVDRGNIITLKDIPACTDVNTDAPIAVISLEQISSLTVHTTEASAAAPPEHVFGGEVASAPTGAHMRITLSCGIAHIFTFAGTVACEGWYEHIRASTASFTHNAYFDDLPCADAFPGSSATAKLFSPLPLLLSGSGGVGLGDAATDAARVSGLADTWDESASMMSSRGGSSTGNNKSQRLLDGGFHYGTAAHHQQNANKNGSPFGDHVVVGGAGPEHRVFSPVADIDYAALFVRHSLPYVARLAEFEFGHLLGAGNFGRVIKCYHRFTNRVFALKIIKKERFRGVRNVVEVRRERRVLEAANHPYILKVHRTFQSADRVYFLLDYLPGGELLRHTQRAPGHHFSESYCKFYLAQLVCALEYLRQHQLLHRDIKGDNLVLDEEGNLVLTDFGFAKRIRPGVANRTCCGTLAYIAPEMLVPTPQGYGYEVDWWSTGVVLFTILTGFFPFLKNKRKDTVEAITTHSLQFPPKPAVSPQAADLCSRLLEKNPLRRIRTLKQVRDHGWYNGFDWTAIESKSARPPYRPLGSQSDISNQGAPNENNNADAPPQHQGSPKDDTLQRDLLDAAQVGYETPEEFTTQQDVFGQFYAQQEAAGSNREDHSSESDNDDVETHFTKGLDRLLGGAPFTSILSVQDGATAASGGVGWGGGGGTMDGSSSTRYHLSSNSLVMT